MTGIYIIFHDGTTGNLCLIGMSEYFAAESEIARVAEVSILPLNINLVSASAIKPSSVSFFAKFSAKTEKIRT